MIEEDQKSVFRFTLEVTKDEKRQFGNQILSTRVSGVCRFIPAESQWCAETQDEVSGYGDHPYTAIARALEAGFFAG